ncbi:TolC family protein [Horticoccus sp. 23ND18S-11]|uniref:TolC family protein n=1 Tax=Horticoccus sp. 23ND18S-11 TaxID=3391832 RepID=UPI0039C93E9D
MPNAPRSLLCLFLVSVGLLGGAESPAVLTLNEALGSVEKANLTVLLSRESVVQALEQVNAARVSTLPIITGTLQQRRTKSVPLTNTGATSARPTNRFDGLLTGSMSIVDLQRWSALRSARMGSEVAQADYNSVLQSILANVAQSYFAHLRNLRRLEVLDANIARARTLLDLARNQLLAGVATQIDVTRAEAQLAQAEQARLQQVTSDLQSELLLKRIIDIPVTRELQLEDFKVQRSDGMLSMFAEDKSTFEKRADYLRAQKAVEQTKVDVRSAKFERLPTLGFTGTFGRGAPNFDDDLQPQWSAAALITVPIFDGFRAGTDKRLAMSRQRAQELRLRNLELQISAELRLAAQDAKSRNAQITVAEKSLRLAQEELRLAQQRYQQGVADNREIVDAQNRLAVAEDNFVEAVYQYNLSRVELARAKGDVRAVLAEKAP